MPRRNITLWKTHTQCMNNSFIEQYHNVIAGDANGEIKTLVQSNGLFTIDRKNQQKVTNSVVVQTELLFLVPTNSLFKPGMLLGRTSAWNVEEEDIMVGYGQGNMAMAKKACPLGGVLTNELFEELYIDFPESREFENLFTSKLFMNTTLMVMSDRIEILKTSQACNNKSKSQSSTKHETTFRITHFIDVLDGNKKYFLKTNMFSNVEHSFEYPSVDQSIIMNGKIDIELIEHLYKNADLANIIKPLQVLSKQ